MSKDNYEIKSKRGLKVTSPPWKVECYLDGVKCTPEQIIAACDYNSPINRAKSKIELIKLMRQ